MKEIDPPFSHKAEMGQNSRSMQCEFGQEHRCGDGQPSGTFEAKQSTPTSQQHVPLSQDEARGRRLSYPKWCANLLFLVLRSRTPFASFVARSIHEPRASSAKQALFPIPLPPGEWLKRMPPRLSQKKRQLHHVFRAISIIVLALNYWHEDGPCDLMLLGRDPNPMHRCLYRSIRDLIKADGPVDIPDFVSVGRKFPQLVARLSELSEALTKLGPGNGPYDKTFQGIGIEAEEEMFEELRPYRSLCPERLKISGSANWDPSPFLDDELYMPFREPALLLLDRTPPVGEYPAIKDVPEAIASLARAWDERGLLCVHDGRDIPVPAYHQVRIFNCFKSKECDRQIGDRRGRNYSEWRVTGPSHSLPGGVDLADIFINPSTHFLAIAVTDRKDFYHQLKTSHRKSLANSVGPAVDQKLLQGTKGYEVFLQTSSMKRKNRSLYSDDLHMSSRELTKMKETPHHFFVAFRAVLQGNHAGIDVATCAHRELLKCHGLLQDDRIVESTRPLFSEDLWEGLCIDDYFVVSREPIGVPLEESKASVQMQRASQVYEEQKILGSKEKDVLSNRAKAVGALVNSSDESRKRGLVTLGAPIEKRLSLSHIILQLAQLSYTTDYFHLSLLGSWVSAPMFRRPLMSLLIKSFHVVNPEE